METFGDLMAQLRAFRDGPLSGDPSNRALARALNVSPQTVANWLSGRHFPDGDPDPVLKLVRMITARGIPAPDGLLDEARWRDAHRAETLKRTGRISDTTTRTRARKATAPGIPLAEATDPFLFEVHHPVEAEGDHPALPPLPPYIPRPHDEELASVVQAAAEGRSALAVLVGGSSTGKTRALWETLKPLNIPNGSWCLHHPLFPAPSSAALSDLPLIAPNTILWLNEAQRYLDSSDGSGEKLAAGLRELLRDPSRAPILILATLWPEDWRTLTASRQRGELDPHAQARELLSGHDIHVPPAFSEADLRTLAEASDPRLVQAARMASDGKATQFIAGAPELLTRYRTASPVTKALITAAMDARRLGMSEAIPLAFLKAAVPAYLDDEDLVAIEAEEWDDWLERALAEAAKPAKGIPGPLTRIPRRGKTGSSGISYLLADYLDQYGRLERRTVPGKEFWDACETLTDPRELHMLGEYAETQGLLFRAARLFKRGVMYGDARSAQDLIWCLMLVSCRGNPQWHVAEYVNLDDALAVAHLMAALRAADAKDVLAALVARDPGAHAAPDKVIGAIALMEELWYAGAIEQAEELAANAADNVGFDSVWVIANLVDTLAHIGSKRSLDVLLRRGLVAHVSLDNRDGVDDLVRLLHGAGAHEEASVLDSRSRAHFGSSIACSVRDRSFHIHRHLDRAAKWSMDLVQYAVECGLWDNPAYRFGREPDGTPAGPWGWDDLVMP